jgi:xanthosine utilization system XapX-like protein
MGCQSSKEAGSNTDVPIPTPIKMGAHSLYAADLSSYEAACVDDPNLQSFDATIQERTNRVINSLAQGIEVRSISLESLGEVTGSLLDMNQEVVKVILECKQDIWNKKDRDLFALVEDFFDNSLQTLEFCNALDKCLKRAREKLVAVNSAMTYFDEEVQNGVEGSTYLKTLKGLKDFKETGDPFTEEFYSLFQKVYTQQSSMLKKLLIRKQKLDKKLKSLKTLKRVSSVIFVAVFVGVLIFSVVAAAIAAPPVITALAGALAVPIGSVGKWCNSLFKKYETALKGQRGVISSMQVGTSIALVDMNNIRVRIDQLEIKIESMVQVADFALGNEDAVNLAIDEIKNKIETFAEIIESLSVQADKCSRQTMKARTVVVQKIIKYSS